MKIIQLSIRDLFWLTVLASVCCAWWYSAATLKPAQVQLAPDEQAISVAPFDEGDRQEFLAQMDALQNELATSQQEEQKSQEITDHMDNVFDGILAWQEKVVVEAGNDVRMELAAAERRLRESGHMQRLDSTVDPP